MFSFRKEYSTAKKIIALAELLINHDILSTNQEIQKRIREQAGTNDDICVSLGNQNDLKENLGLALKHLFNPGIYELYQKQSEANKTAMRNSIAKAYVEFIKAQTNNLNTVSFITYTTPGVSKFDNSNFIIELRLDETITGKATMIRALNEVVQNLNAELAPQTNAHSVYNNL